MKNAAVKLVFLTGLIGAGCVGGLAIRSARIRSQEANALKLDAVTEAIFAHADKVEALRLGDIQEIASRTGTEFIDLANQKYGVAGGYTLLRPVRLVNTNFAPRLREPLRLTPDPKTAIARISGCFDPGVGFRVWRGKTYNEVFVCFYCQGVEIVTTDEHKNRVARIRNDVGAARKSLLALSREAFPEDKVLQGLKDSL